MSKILAIVGPTASGKTKLAIEQKNAVIINCDSLQIYKAIPTLTAYPTPEERAAAPHKLFGYLEYNQNTDVTEWAELAAEEIKKAWKNNLLPVLVGGTGFYLSVLANGISPLPEINSEIREKARNLSYDTICKEINAQRPENHHQTIRAWEVYKQTGKRIEYFFSLPKKKFIEGKFEYIFINPPRRELYDKINKRFDLMLKGGAIEEVRDLLKNFGDCNYKDLFKKYHIFKAIGAKEIAMYLNGDMTYNDMVNLSKQYSRNYAKRQITWFKKMAKNEMAV